MYCSVATRDRFLRLHDFDVAGDAGGEAIARLGQLLVGEVARLAGDRQLPGGRVEIEKRRAHLVVDRRLQVVGFRAPVAEVGVGLEQPAARAAALEDRHVDRAGDREGRAARRTGERPMAP